VKALCFLFLLYSFTACAAEFRFFHNDSTTGICNTLYDAKGMRTDIVITKDSAPEPRAVLNALLDKYIFGTRGWESRDGMKWQQGIILLGEFASPTRYTRSRSPEKYREFRLTGIKVAFPMTRFVDAAGVESIDPPMVMETYFGFDSLFPRGIMVNGKRLELNKFSAKRSGTK